MNEFISQLTAQVSKTTTGSTAKSNGSEILDTIVTSLDIFKNIILGIVIIIVFYLLGKLIASRIIKSLKEAKGESLYPDMIALINRFSVFGSLSIGVAAVLQFIFDLDFIQVISFFGLGISFAFKDLLENLIAGAMVIIQNRFRIGDFISIGTGAGAIKGKIMEIQTRATILKAVDGTEIVVPNSELMTNAVISYTAHHSRRIEFPLRIDFEADLKKAIQIAEKILTNKPHVLQKPKPKILVKSIGGSTINLSVKFWVDPKNKEKSWVMTKSEIISEIKEAFDKAGILIPYPTYTYMEDKRKIPETPEVQSMAEETLPIPEPVVQ